MGRSIFSCCLAESVKAPTPVWVVGQCECGQCKIRQRRPGGIVTYKCHCKGCREYSAQDTQTKGAHSLLTVDWCCNVQVEGPILTSADEGVARNDRGKCSHCKQPVINNSYESCCGIHWGTCFITVVSGTAMNRGLPDSQQLQPEFNMYWNEGEDHHYKSSDDKEFLDAVADNPMKDSLMMEREDDGLPQWNGDCSNFWKLQCVMCPRMWLCCIQGWKPCCICCNCC